MTNDLISREALKVVFKVTHAKELNDIFKGWDLSEIRKTLDEAPTIDAVEVVRCKDCECAVCVDKNEDFWRCTHPQWIRHCAKDTYAERELFHGLSGNDYCSYGECKESENTP